MASSDKSSSEGSYSKPVDNSDNSDGEYFDQEMNQRPDPKPVDTSDDSDPEEYFDQEMNDATEEVNNTSDDFDPEEYIQDPDETTEQVERLPVGSPVDTSDDSDPEEYFDQDPDQTTDEQVERLPIESDRKPDNSGDSNGEYFNQEMNQTIEQVRRKRVRSDHKPVYTIDDSDEEDIGQEMDQTTGERVDNPLSKIHKILDYAFRPTTSDDNEEPNGVFVSQYLVKWKHLSYLHCSWVPEKEFEKAYKLNPFLKSRVNKFHSNKELKSEEGDEFVAIRPEWTSVDRILASREKGDVKEYLVKFKEQPYDEIFWETESDISSFQKEIQRFNDINSATRRVSFLENETFDKKFEKFDQTPDYLLGSLHPYQLEGLNFLRHSWSEETNVILADEMGLGKTVQSIAFLASLFNENIAPHIVIAPLSTLRNWEREFALWSPQLNVVMYTGSFQARQVIRDVEFYIHKEKTIKLDVLLTSYEMINLDTDFLKTIKWNCMIVDEGHRLKNKDSKLFFSLNQYNCKHRVLLTGTPLQNNLEELFTLMEFLDAGKFGRLETFREEFEDITQEEQISKLHKLLAPHLLRRVKKDVLKCMLPSKRELILRVDMSEHQKHLYKAIMTRNYQILANKGGAKTSNVLMELRKVCSHPYLEADQPELEDANEASKQLIEASGKLQLLDQLMVKLKEQGHRVLIYCQFRGMLNILEEYCSSKNWFYERIDGLVDGAQRQVRIDRFNAENSNRFCFLLSTRAGGLGINLATADTVIIYDSDWNPHADIQAMARAHRLGQTGKVMVYRLITRGTVEERMMHVTKQKMLMDHLVVKWKPSDFGQEKLDEIIKYGSKELFSQENDEASGKSGKIHYDDASIEKLLDRDHIEADDDGKDNEFLKAFKVANFECISEVEADKLDQPQAFEPHKTYSERLAERKGYWKELLKESHEVYQAQELNALGKRKRNCKQRMPVKEDDPETISLESDEAEPSSCKPTVRKYPKGVTRSRRKDSKDNSKPMPLMEGEKEYLKVLGFKWNERRTFKLAVMRFGIGDSDWKEFIPLFKFKTYEEIKAYGILFMKHLLENSDNTSTTFEDGVPKEDLNTSEVLIRIAEMKLFHEKCKFLEENPMKDMFAQRIIIRFGLRGGKIWKDEHDKILIRAVFKNGFGKWSVILTDEEFELEEFVKQEVLSYGTRKVEIGESSSSVNQTTITDDGNNGSADGSQRKLMKPQFEMITKCREFVTKRVHLLKRALNFEYAEEEYHGRRRSTENETNVMDIAGGSVVRVPKTEPMNSYVEGLRGPEKQGRAQVTQLYNQMCMNPNENLGESSVQAYVDPQPVSVIMREDIRPSTETDHDVKMNDSVEEPGSSRKPRTETDHDVKMEDSAQEPGSGINNVIDLTIDED